jgi:hypothetical protein
MLSYGGDLTGARETTGRRGGAHRSVVGGAARLGVDGGVGDTTRVDIGVGGFGHGGDGSNRVTAASDSGGRDTARSRRRHVTAASDSGGRDAAQSGALLIPHARVRQRRPRQPIRARRGATLPLTAGPHASVVFQIKNHP